MNFDTKLGFCKKHDVSKTIPMFVIFEQKPKALVSAAIPGTFTLADPIAVGEERIAWQQRWSEQQCIYDGAVAEERHAASAIF